MTVREEGWVVGEQQSDEGKESWRVRLVETGAGVNGASDRVSLQSRSCSHSRRYGVCQRNITTAEAQ